MRTRQPLEIRVFLGSALVAACAHADAGPSAPAPTPRVTDTAETADPDDEGDEPPVETLRSGSPPSVGAAGSALLAEAEREFTMAKSSTYSHHTHVDESAGTFDYDCSGFAVYALSRAVPDGLRALQASTPRRPRSREIVAFLETIPPAATLGRWTRVARVADLEPGDLVSWTKPPTSKSKNTGHTILVRAAIQPDPTESGAFFIPVIDSTSTPHVPGDTRLADHKTGLGEGEVVLIADPTGAPSAYRWSRGAKSPAKATTIVLGRLR